MSPAIFTWEPTVDHKGRWLQGLLKGMLISALVLGEADGRSPWSPRVVVLRPLELLKLFETEMLAHAARLKPTARVASFKQSPSWACRCPRDFMRGQRMGARDCPSLPGLAARCGLRTVETG
jgi:hypothetical protein